MLKEEFEQRKQMICEFVTSKKYRPLTLKEMRGLLQVPAREKRDFNEVLEALMQDGKIMVDIKGRIKPVSDKVRVGRFMATQRGFGFVRVEGEDDDIFIGGSDTLDAMDGDTVQVQLTKSAGEGRRREGVVLHVLERGTDILVGTYTRSRNYGFVIPDNQKFTKDI